MGLVWFTTAPPIPDGFKISADWQMLRGNTALSISPIYLTDFKQLAVESLVTVWCQYAYSAFCLQWLAVGWAMIVGKE